MKLLELLFVYVIGALGYGGIETAWRGGTHWTMPLLGGGCFLLIYAVTAFLSLSLPWKWLICAASITAIEFCAGCLLNLALGWEIWDYSGLRGNVLGQICPFYALCWLGLSVPASGLAWAIRHWLFCSVLPAN